MRRRKDEWGPFIAAIPAAFLLAFEGACLAISEIIGTEQEDATIWAIFSVVLTAIALVGGAFIAFAATHCHECLG